MTKKDYIRLAKVIAGIADDHECGAHCALCAALDVIATDFADTLGDDNPEFDPDRFIAACKVR